MGIADLRITELMIDPRYGRVEAGAWLELTNSGDTAVNIGWLRIEDELGRILASTGADEALLQPGCSLIFAGALSRRVFERCYGALPFGAHYAPARFDLSPAGGQLTVFSGLTKGGLLQVLSYPKLDRDAGWMSVLYSEQGHIRFETLASPYPGHSQYSTLSHEIERRMTARAQAFELPELQAPPPLAQEHKCAGVCDDFQLGQDQLDLSDFGISDMAQLRLQAIGGGTRIHLEDGLWLDLSGVLPEQLTRAEFILKDQTVLPNEVGLNQAA